MNGRLAYNLTNGLTVGGNLSYDQAFDTRVSADIKYRFSANGYGAPSIRKPQPVVMPVIQALSATPANRDVRVHDSEFYNDLLQGVEFISDEDEEEESRASNEILLCLLLSFGGLYC